MGNDDIENDFYHRYKKNIEPIIAISILILLIFGVVELYKDNQLKEQIAEKCGYEKGGYECYCEAGFIAEKHLEYDRLVEKYKYGGEVDVPMDWFNNSESSD
jgi:hypothetical protein